MIACQRVKLVELASDLDRCKLALARALLKSKLVLLIDGLFDGLPAED